MKMEPFSFEIRLNFDGKLDTSFYSLDKLYQSMK